MTTLSDISGIGPKTAEVLASHGFADVNAIANATPESLAAVPGFSEARATRTIEAAKALGASVEQAVETAEDTPAQTVEAEAKKGKSKKKDKTKGKKKDKKKKKR